MKRIPEPEVMDDPAQVLAYARADFSDSNTAFVRDAVRLCAPAGDTILDLGCGPAEVSILIALAFPHARVVAVDASEAMLELARDAVANAGLTERLQLVNGRLPGVKLTQESFATIVCKDVLHHLPTPAVLWAEVRRLAAPGAAVCVMDLVRPADKGEASRIVERVSADEHELLKRDFFNSLCAAFTPEEVREQLRDAGLPLQVEQISDRHMRISGRVSTPQPRPPAGETPS